MKEFFMKKKTIYLALLLIVTSFLSGCTYNVYPNATLPQKPLIEQLPLTVGVYYSDEFQTYELVPYIPQSTAIYRIVLGPPSIALFDQIFSEMFEKVVQVSSLPPLPEAKTDIKAVIKPNIEGLVANADLNRMIPSDTWVQVDIYYMINLYDLNSALIASWSIKGSGSVRGSLKYPLVTAMVRDAAQNAMQNAAARFMLGFRKNSEAIKWLRSFGITASK
jgi:hypothetical protein